MPEVICQDYGQSIASQVARRLVISIHRKGGKAPFIEARSVKMSDQFSHAIDGARENLHTSFNIDELVCKASMLRRSFDRKFRLAFEETSQTWLTHSRLELAKQLLERGNIDQIAELAGLDKTATLCITFAKLCASLRGNTAIRLRHNKDRAAEMLCKPQSQTHVRLTAVWF